MRIVFGLATFLLVGCGPDTPEHVQRVNPGKMPIENSDRFEVRRVQVFEDPLAYYDRRGIYLIHDRKTGREFLGVSGVGVTEVGRHSAGKTSVEHEE
jgi:hypothetical protein